MGIKPNQYKPNQVFETKGGLITLIKAYEYNGISRNGLFMCYCKKLFEASINNVKIKKTNSCGCLKKTNPGRPKKENSLIRHPLYRKWFEIKNKPDSYPMWIASFEDFIRDVKYELGDDYIEKNVSITRIDERIGYEPGNIKPGRKAKQQQ
jgi:hypothetical protein